MRFFIVLLGALFLFTFESLSGHTKVEDKLKKYLLPANHPLQTVLPKLFEKAQMFDSDKDFNAAGFTNLNRNKNRVLAGTHPKLGEYLIKKYQKNVSRDFELDKYLTRITVARKIKKLIRAYKLKHVVVPKKWIYQLPEQFNDPKTNAPSYVLIVEKLDLLDREQVKEEYKNLDLETLKEIGIITYHFKGINCTSRNIPITVDKKIAFIDTERGDRKRRRKKASRSFTAEQNAYILSVYKELDEKN